MYFIKSMAKYFCCQGSFVKFTPNLCLPCIYCISSKLVQSNTHKTNSNKFRQNFDKCAEKFLSKVNFNFIKIVALLWHTIWTLESSWKNF